MATPAISVVVLAYRGADTIRDFVDSLVASLEKENLSWEIVLVGNYFEEIEDKTPVVIREICSTDSRIKAVTKIKEGMMGWDMRTGLQAATGKTLAIIDGDGQMPHDDVIRAYQLMKDNRVDFVKTYRERRSDGVYRRLISTVYNVCFRLLFPGLGCRDINSKPKIMTRAFYEKINLKSNGWFIDAEIMIFVRRFNASRSELATVFHNIDSRSSFITPYSILEFFTNLIWYRIKEWSSDK